MCKAIKSNGEKCKLRATINGYCATHFKIDYLGKGNDKNYKDRKKRS